MITIKVMAGNLLYIQNGSHYGFPFGRDPTRPCIVRRPKTSYDKWWSCLQLFCPCIHFLLHSTRTLFWSLFSTWSNHIWLNYLDILIFCLLAFYHHSNILHHLHTYDYRIPKFTILSLMNYQSIQMVL